MGYQDDVAAIVADRRDELEDDLHAAKRIVESLRSQLVEAERRVQSYEALLAFDPQDVSSPADAPIGHVTLHVAMQIVLKDAPKQMMWPADLASAIHARGLYRMRDGRPVEPQQIHARVGNYENLFERDGSYIKLR